MPIRFLNRVRGGDGRAFDADVLLWQGAVVANGGSVSLARLIVVDQFVFSEKSSGGWALTDDYFATWGENPGQALVSLKQRRAMTPVNSPTFTADRGYVGDGVTTYIDTGFVPSTHAVAMTGTNLRIAAYERTALSQTSTYATGTLGSTNQNLSMNPRRASTGTVTFGANCAVIGAAVATNLGFTAGSRNGSTYEQYKNGIYSDPGVPGATVSTLAPVSLFIHAYNNNGAGPAGLRATSVGFVVAGAALSAAQELAQYNAVQAWATSIGAQV